MFETRCNFSATKIACVNGPEGTLSKPRRQRQRERHQTKGLMSKPMAVHVRYKSLSISYPSSTKQQREITNQVLRILKNVNDGG